MILKPKPCSFPLKRYGCCKNHFCIHVNGDVNFDKLVHENMFYRVMPAWFSQIRSHTYIYIYIYYTLTQNPAI